MAGHRARIGYISAAYVTELFPKIFYQMVPDGVTLAMLTQQAQSHADDEMTRSHAETRRAAVAGAKRVGVTHPPNPGRELKQAHPEADTLLYSCPHLAHTDAIEPLERELSVNVITSLQAIVWEGLRKCGIDDRIDGYGRLLREH